MSYERRRDDERAPAFLLRAAKAITDRLRTDNDRGDECWVLDRETNTQHVGRPELDVLFDAVKACQCEGLDTAAPPS